MRQVLEEAQNKRGAFWARGETRGANELNADKLQRLKTIGPIYHTFEQTTAFSHSKTRLYPLSITISECDCVEAGAASVVPKEDVLTVPPRHQVNVIA